MKTILRATTALLLCVVLFLCLAPGGFAGTDTGLTPVRFYNEKGYDLVGLSVQDADGKEREPVSTKDGWAYLLEPGTYSYRYHDDREIFDDLEQSFFTVGGDGLEIQVTLTAVFADNFGSFTEVNPLYEDILDESDLVSPDVSEEEILDGIVRELIDEAANGSRRRGSLRAVSYVDSAAGTLRSGMVNREEIIEATAYSSATWTEDEADSFAAQVIRASLSHTGYPGEGDTLRFEYGGIKCKYIRNAGTSGNYRHTFTFTVTYYTTAEQEQAAANKVADLVSALGLEGKSDLEKILTIHEYLYSNVTYDYTHVNNTSYLLQYSGYAALVQNCAVCQGYSIAFYRLCLASGIDARIVGSVSMNHAWNIVQLGGLYYELDATWDASRYRSGSTALPYYFLRGSSWWLANHKVNGNSVIGDQFDSNSKYYDPTFNNYTLPADDYSYYLVTYDANGGSGAPARQIKLHGQPLTLSETQPARSSDSAGSYTVTLNANGGSVGTTSLTAERTRNYTFKNWNTAAAGVGTGYASGGIYTNNASATLYAQWNSSIVTASVTLPTPTRDGYIFNGWTASSSASSGVTGSCTPSGNVTLSAIWLAQYTVSYDANGGSGAPASQTKTQGQALTLSEAQPTRSSVSAGSYTVTLDANGGSVGTSSLTAARTTSYTFSNWNTAAGGGGTGYASGGTYTNDAPATLYAQWNSSTATASVTLPTPTRDGYDFKGWAASGSAAGGVTGSYTPGGSKTLYAVWERCAKLASGTWGSLYWELDNSGLLTISGSGDMDPFDTTDNTYDTRAWNAYRETVRTVAIIHDVTSIGGQAFRDCTALTRVMIPASVTEIGDWAFSGCGDLTGVTIPEGVQKIGDMAFSKTGLTDITLPKTLASFSGTALEGCDNLTAIHADAGNTVYCDDDGVLFNKEMTKLVRFPCGRSGSYTIPLGVTSIGEYAFSACGNLTGIVIPSGVTSIGAGAFSEGAGLTSVTVPVSVNTIGDGAFYNCASLTDICYGGIREQWEQISIGSDNTPLTLANIDYIMSGPDFVLPAALAEIGDEAFMGGAFSYVKLSENTTAIGKNAFADCPNLTYIYIPATTTSIAQDAFGTRTSLTILGKADSTAQSFAEDHSFSFIALT